MNISSALSGIVVLLWVAAIAMVVFAVVRASRGFKVKGMVSAIIGIIVTALLVTLLNMGVVFINPEYRGVVISALNSQGYRSQALDAGLNFVVPGLENVILYPISRQTYTMSIAPLEGDIQGDDSIAARTADGQEIYVDASVIYAIDPGKVVTLHIEWQGRYIDEFVRPQVRGVIRDAVSQFGVEEVVTTRRFEMAELINKNMAQKFSDNGLVLVDFVLRNITFSEEYAASVEQKQIAEQLAQQAAFVVEQKRQEAEQARQTAQGLADAAVIRAEGEAEARLIQAEAEAEALRMIADALENNPDLLTYNYINQLSPNIQVMLVPSDNPFILPLPGLQDVPVTTP